MATPKKAAPKASTKKGTTKTAPRVPTKAGEPFGVTEIPEGATVIPDHKYDDVIGFLEGTFPEIGKNDETLYLLLAIIDDVMPGPNLRYSYSKARDSFHEQLRGKLSGWDLPRMGKKEDLAGYNEFLAKELKALLDNICGYNSITQAPAAITVQPVLPIPQWKDYELINAFIDEPREEEVIEELEKRSKGLPFLALKDGIYSRSISFDLLKISRRGDPTPLTVEGHQIYTMSQVDIKNRIRQECPLCEGVALVRSTCPSCHKDFSEATANMRQDIRIASMAARRVYPTCTPAMFPTLWPAEEEYSYIPGYTQLRESLKASGRMPNLLIVDDPIAIENPASTLRAVDAFHRSLGSAKGGK